MLIIKPGYSETLVNEISRTTSLGDVLRSTVLLHLFKDAKVSWLVDEKAILLLKGNPYIERIFPYDLTSVLQLQAERFDTVINLEKVAGLCALADSINAWRRYGFRFDPDSGTAKAYDGSQHVIEMCINPDDKISSNKYWEHILFEMVGSEWQGELPILGYQPKEKEEKFNIGFNFNVGNKWPVKAWPTEYWKALEEKLSGKHTVSWQEGQNSIEDYIDWINSVDLLVTNDSLGLHIAHALDKKIVSLFGPTISTEVYLKSGVKLLPEKEYDCLPCLSTECIMERSCMYDISVETVYANIEKLFKEKA